MAYTTNPHMPKVRRDAVNLVKYRNWSIRKVARRYGVSPSTVSRWCKHPYGTGWVLIPTESSKPKTSPKALDKEIVKKIIEKRISNRRCGQVIYYQLKNEDVEVSLSSVQRTLDRCHLLKKRSPWKRPHDPTKRPLATHSGALIQVDTIHIRLPDGNRLYVYTLIDLFSRWTCAGVTEKLSVASTIKFIDGARRIASFNFEMIQTDHGPEFTTKFTHAMWRRKIKHRHSRVRKPNDNAHIERFNRTIQEECINRTANNLLNLKKEIAKYLKYYNEERLHMGINYQTPQQVLRRC